MAAPGTRRRGLRHRSTTRGTTSARRTRWRQRATTAGRALPGLRGRHGDPRPGARTSSRAGPYGRAASVRPTPGRPGVQRRVRRPEHGHRSASRRRSSGSAPRRDVGCTGFKLFHWSNGTELLAFTVDRDGNPWYTATRQADGQFGAPVRRYRDGAVAALWTPTPGRLAFAIPAPDNTLNLVTEGVKPTLPPRAYIASRSRRRRHPHPGRGLPLQLPPVRTDRHQALRRGPPRPAPAGVLRRPGAHRHAPAGDADRARCAGPHAAASCAPCNPGASARGSSPGSWSQAVTARFQGARQRSALRIARVEGERLSV